MFVIDTGLVGHAGSLNSKVVPALLKERLLTEVRTANTIDAGGGKINSVFKMSAFELAGFRHENLFFFEHSGIPSTLGLGYWSRFIVTFDVPNRALYLKPSKRFALPAVDCGSGASRVGLAFNRRGGQVVVARVAEGGTAEAAGLEVGDVLLKVGGTSVDGARLFAVHSLFDTSIRTCNITVLRGSEEKRLLIDMRPSPRDDGADKRHSANKSSQINGKAPLLHATSPGPAANDRRSRSASRHH